MLLRDIIVRDASKANESNRSQPERGEGHSVMSNKEGNPVAQGSGCLISKDGRVVTNYHVIKGGNCAVIKLPNSAFFPVDGVLASDKDHDIA